jgi:hypothetical protein
LTVPIPVNHRATGSSPVVGASEITGESRQTVKHSKPENVVIQHPFRAKNGTAASTSQTRGQTDLIGKMFAAAMTRYLNAITPPEEVAGVASIFRRRLH